MRVDNSTEGYKKTEKTSSGSGGEGKKAITKKKPSEENEKTSNEASKVELKSKAKPETSPSTEKAAQNLAEKSTSSGGSGNEKDLKNAEDLMAHVNSGKLSGSEKDSALKRVGEILRRYSNN